MSCHSRTTLELEESCGIETTNITHSRIDHPSHTIVIEIDGNTQAAPICAYHSASDEIRLIQDCCQMSSISISMAILKEKIWKMYFPLQTSMTSSWTREMNNNMHYSILRIDVVKEYVNAARAVVQPFWLEGTTVSNNIRRLEISSSIFAVIIKRLIFKHY